MGNSSLANRSFAAARYCNSTPLERNKASSRSSMSIGVGRDGTNRERSRPAWSEEEPRDDVVRLLPV